MNFELQKYSKKVEKMKKYTELSRKELEALYASLEEKYKNYKSAGLKLDISRGKPNADQLDVSQAILNAPMSREDCHSKIGVDLRNYGILDGIPEMKKLFSELYGIKEEYIIVGGNSSLQLMFDAIARAMVFGVKDSPRPWCEEPERKWICVTPGYDRHFRISETFGFKLISVPMIKDGPDMDKVEELVKDPTVKGIWCVPKYSNPTGNTYSDEVVRRLASMECAASDFRIMWDNAYAVHDFNENGDELLDIFSEAEKYGNLDRVFYFSSTSKITFPGGGVALMATSPENKKQILPILGAQTIGYDKINQLRHVRYFENAGRVHEHMMKLAELIGKKFEICLKALSELDGLGIAQWTKPNGGYFISLDVKVGSAKRVFELMNGAGVTLTDVGATFPYGIDPNDENLRIAPTYPTDDELRLATEILVTVLKFVAVSELLGK